MGIFSVLLCILCILFASVIMLFSCILFAEYLSDRAKCILWIESLFGLKQDVFKNQRAGYIRQKSYLPRCYSERMVKTFREYFEWKPFNAGTIRFINKDEEQSNCVINGRGDVTIPARYYNATIRFLQKRKFTCVISHSYNADSYNTLIVHAYPENVAPDPKYKVIVKPKGLYRCGNMELTAEPQTAKGLCSYDYSYILTKNTIVA